MLLEVKNVTVQYGKIAAINDVSLDVEKGEIVTLIGGNGAGKTTTLRAVCGMRQPVTGEIWFKGQRIDGLPVQKIVQLGVAHAPEGRRLFDYMTVKDTLLAGAFLQKNKNEIQRSLDRVYGHFPKLKERRKQVACTLSGGEQQMLTIGRALMANPMLLLLDEPSLGLAPLLIQEIFTIIEDINRSGVTIVLVEQNSRMALKVAHRAFVLEVGRIVLTGEASGLLDDTRVKAAYLGE
jgi:branched-chain amino acid transport system ATP-binding protein